MCVDIERHLLCTCIISVFKLLLIGLPSFYLISMFLSSTVLVDFKYEGKLCPTRISLHHISRPWIKCFVDIRHERKGSMLFMF
jgi:hypothetical protein